MPDLPILMSAPMVRATLREIEQPGTGKTQTRRIINPQPIVADNGSWRWEGRNGGFVGAMGTHVDEGFPESAKHWCRIQPGDRLYIREAWHAARGLDSTPPRDIPRDADIEHAATARSYAEIGLKGKLRPGMHMPRWASRLTLTVTDVRVQRLQEISEADAIAEGLERNLDGDADDRGCCIVTEQYRGADFLPWLRDPIEAFSDLWDQINVSRGYGWDANPWVAAYTFRPVLGNIDQVRS